LGKEAKVLLKIENLFMGFNQNENSISILKGANFDLKIGESIAVVGPSGIGKSTLLALIAGMEKPNDGKIYFNGVDIVPWTESMLTKYRRQHLGFVFQQFHLISHLTAVENVRLALDIQGVDSKEAQERATQMMEKMRLSHRQDHLPSQLSGGECQRVAIARALITKPSLVLADEPSGNLDEATGSAVIEEFFSLARSQKTSLLIVTHSAELAQMCDRILRLQNGLLVEASA
jgi:putative ABC transport system ATP-binding protein